MTQMEWEAKKQKAIARSASKRNAGRRGRTVRLPSDNLTPKQRERLNGPVRSYNLHAPMAYIAFRALPEDLQRLYYAGLQARAFGDEEG